MGWHCRDHEERRARNTTIFFTFDENLQLSYGFFLRESNPFYLALMGTWFSWVWFFFFDWAFPYGRWPIFFMGRNQCMGPKPAWLLVICCANRFIFQSEQYICKPIGAIYLRAERFDVPCHHHRFGFNYIDSKHRRVLQHYFMLLCDYSMPNK